MSNEDDRSAFESAGEEKQLTLIQEFWVFIVDNKAWWMIPLILILSIAGLFAALASTGAAPFIYTLF